MKDEKLMRLLDQAEALLTAIREYREENDKGDVEAPCSGVGPGYDFVAWLVNTRSNTSGEIDLYLPELIGEAFESGCFAEFFQQYPYACEMRRVRFSKLVRALLDGQVKEVGGERWECRFIQHHSGISLELRNIGSVEAGI